MPKFDGLFLGRGLILPPSFVDICFFVFQATNQPTNQAMKRQGWKHILLGGSNNTALKFSWFELPKCTLYLISLSMSLDSRKINVYQMFAWFQKVNWNLVQSHSWTMHPGLQFIFAVHLSTALSATIDWQNKAYKKLWSRNALFDCCSAIIGVDINCFLVQRELTYVGKKQTFEASN